MSDTLNPEAHIHRQYTILVLNPRTYGVIPNRAHSGTAPPQRSQEIEMSPPDSPRQSGPRVVIPFPVPYRYPYSTVTLESTAEGNLPDCVTTCHANLRLDVPKHIPNG